MGDSATRMSKSRWEDGSEERRGGRRAREFKGRGCILSKGMQIKDLTENVMLIMDA